MRLQEVTLYENKSHRILKEGWQDLTEAQQKYQLLWEKELWPLLAEYVKLCEAELTPDEIAKIFQSAEQVQNDLGKNTNALGKAGNMAAAAAKLPVDIAKKVDAKINELGKMAQNAGPVKDADAKFEKLKQDIMSNKPDSKIVQGIVKVSDWAKANPGKASLAVGILTTIAAFVGGPAGGMAAGLILRSTNELLKGEKLSAAVGKAVKTAAYGAIAGWALEGIGDWLEGMRMDVVPYDKAPGLTTIEVGFKDTLSAPGFESVREIGSMVVPEDQVPEFQKLLDTMLDATAATGKTTDGAALDAFDDLWNFAKTFDSAEFIDNMNLQNDIAKNIALANDEFLQNLSNANDAIAAIAQGSIQSQGEKGAFKVGGDEIKPGDVVTSAAGNKKIAGVDSKATAVDPSDLKGRANIMRAAGESVDMEARFNKYLEEKQINEAPFGDMIKGAAKKVGGAVAKGAKAVGAKAKEVGNELGSITTAKKLNSLWVKAGKPTDAGSIVNILQQGGVEDETIATIAKQAGVKLPKPSAANAQSGEKGNTSGATGGDVDPKIQTLADAIKKAGVAKEVKAMLAV